MDRSPLIAGFDIGGTNTRCALARASSPDRLIAHRVAPTPAASNGDAFLSFLETLYEGCARAAGETGTDVAGLGCALPGITDAHEGRALAVSNLPYLNDTPLAARMAERFGCPVVVENDVNAAAVAEYRFGAHDAPRGLVYLTVSTGVAAGIIVNGRLVRGAHHAAGELGYILPDPDHIGKDWGANGCLELTAAGVGLARCWAALKGGDASPDRAREVFAAAEAGDARAQALVDRAADYLAQTVVSIAALLDPDVVLLGGSIARNEPVVGRRIQDVVAMTIPYPPAIRPAVLEDRAPLVGALALITDQLDRHHRETVRPAPEVAPSDDSF